MSINKYRVWDKDLNQYITDRDGIEVAIKNNGTLINTKGEKIENVVVEHCTGLSAVKSYRGNKPEDLLIFDGDIIQTDLGNKLKIVFELLGWRAKPIGKENTSLVSVLYAVSKGIMEVEVIGNIHEEVAR